MRHVEVEMAGPLDFAWGVLKITWDTVFQRLWMGHLPALDDMHGSARGLTCIITGPTSGIGREVAATLARRGAHVILACRSLTRGKAVKEALETDERTKCISPACIEVEELDVASLASVKSFAARWQRRNIPLNLLINNAGIFSMGSGREETEDGFEAHMGTNFLGSFLLTCLLLPSLRQAGEKDQGRRRARIVNVASMMHLLSPGIDPANPMLKRKGTFSPAAAYNNSKLAQIQLTAELRRRVPRGWSVDTYAVHPGEVMTNVVRSMPRALQTAYRILLRAILLTPSEGARSVIEAALAEQPGGTAGKKEDPLACYIGSDCRLDAASKASLDAQQCAWTWSWAVGLTGLPPEFDLPAAGP